MQAEDLELVQRGQQGDLEAFNALVERYQSQVYNLAARMLSNRASAEDATQEAFISAYKNIGKFRGGNLKSWLFRIALNTCHDFLRATRRRSQVYLDEATSEGALDLPSKEESPEEHALRRELGQEIQKGLATLPEDQRRVLVLVDLHSFSYDEVAEATRTSIGTVKSRLSRGRARLRDYLLTRRELLPMKFRLLK